jgi:cyanophycin synthetase
LAIRAELLEKRPKIAIDAEARALLKARGYARASVIPAGEFVPLRRKGNISAGGTYRVVPVEEIHPDNAALAANAAATIGLDLAGIDIISEDPRRSWHDTGGIICEVNASPQIGYTGTEEIFGEILTGVLGGNGRIPLHLLLVQNGLEPPMPMPDLAAAAECNAAAWGTHGWIARVGRLGPFADVFQASRAILFNPQVDSAMIAMSENEAMRFGLPAAQFASIRLAGTADWRVPMTLQQLIAPHSQRIVRTQPGPSTRAGQPM